MNFIKFETIVQQDIVAVPFKDNEIQELLRYSAFFQMKNVEYWQSICDLLLKTRGTSQITTKLNAFKLMLQVKSCEDKIHVIRPMIDETLKQVPDPQILRQLKLTNLVDFAYIIVKLNQRQYINICRTLADYAAKNRAKLDNTLPANSLSDLAYVLYKAIPPGDEIRGTVSNICHAYQTQDEVAYDATMQDMEYRDQLPGYIGMIDHTRWPNIANVATICCDPEYTDTELLTRLEETIFRKAESDLVDFDSAARILAAFRTIGLVNPSFVMRILEMVQWQLKNEGSSQLTQFDGTNIALFLRTVSNVYSPDLDASLVDVLFEYFEGLLRSNDISRKFTVDNLKELYQIYERAYFYKMRKDTFLKTLQERIDKANASTTTPKQQHDSTATKPPVNTP
jgi:hypothetical protein